MEDEAHSHTRGLAEGRKVLRCGRLEVLRASESWVTASVSHERRRESVRERERADHCLFEDPCQAGGGGFPSRESDGSTRTSFAPGWAGLAELSSHPCQAQLLECS